MNLLKSVIVLLGVFSFVTSCSNPMAVDTSSQNKEEIVVTTTTTIIFSIVPDTPKLMTIVERSKDGNKSERRKVETKTGKVTTIKDLKELKKIINDNEYLVFENGLTKEKIMNFKSRDDFGKHIKEYNNKNINRSIDWDFTWDMFRLENNLGEGNIEVSGRVVDAVLKIKYPNDPSKNGWPYQYVTIVEKNVAYVNYIYFTYDNGSFQPRIGTYPWGGNYTYYEWVSKWENILISRDMVTIGCKTDGTGRYTFKGIKDGTQLTFRIIDPTPNAVESASLISMGATIGLVFGIIPLELSPSLYALSAYTGSFGGILHAENRTETFTINNDTINNRVGNKNRLDFQVSINLVYEIMLNHIPDKCSFSQKGVVMTTVLTKYDEKYPHEAQIGGATVELIPIEGGSTNYRKYYWNPKGRLSGSLGDLGNALGLQELPLPEKGYTTTFDGDGGVCFVDVDPGTYKIRASKTDSYGRYEFQDAIVKVDRGTVSNACYPNGVSLVFDPRKDYTHLQSSNCNGGGLINLTYHYKNGKTENINFNLYSGYNREYLNYSEEVVKITLSGCSGGGDSSTTHSLYLNNKVIYSWKGAYPPSNTLYDTNPPVTTTTLPLSIPFTIDAAVNFGNGKIYLFKGTQYSALDIATDKVVPVYYPTDIKTNWSGMPWSSVDAAVNIGNDKVYFFKGTQYCRYDVASNSVDSRYYPTDIQTNWSGMPWSSVDAAVNYGNGKIYFFKGTQYCRYDIATDRVDPGYYPADIQTNWSGMPWSSVDAAVNKGNGKIYFFKGTQYCRYDIATERVDPGYPVELNNLNWSGVKF